MKISFLAVLVVSMSALGVHGVPAAIAEMVRVLSFQLRFTILGQHELLKSCAKIAVAKRAAQYGAGRGGAIQARRADPLRCRRVLSLQQRCKL